MSEHQAFVDYVLEHNKETEVKAFLAWAYYGVEGFDAFYELVHGIRLPDHALEWVKFIFKAMEEGKQGVVIQAFRGSWKTTTLTITFTAWYMGHHPEHRVLLVQVGDDIANDNTKAIAGLIENHEAWKMCFPHVVPDPDKGWGAGGYFVKQTHERTYDGENVVMTPLSDAEWEKKVASEKDPSLLGVGYRSRAIIGKHPKLLIVDDIHDENNTISARELAGVLRIVKGTIMPTMHDDTLAVWFGTPWVKGDTLDYVRKTGEFLILDTPVENDDKKPVFPAVWNRKAIERKRKLSGDAEFARMYLLDLEAAGNTVFSFMSYPHEHLLGQVQNMPMQGGTDYASTIDAKEKKPGTNDAFAIAFLVRLPLGGCVVWDGILDENPTQSVAESHMWTAQEMWPLWINNRLETDGKGQEFYQLLARNPKLRIIPVGTKGKGKYTRLERTLAPWFNNGTIRVSDRETPFLDKLRLEMRSYPLAGDDCLDSVFHGVMGMPDVLRIDSFDEDMPTPEEWLVRQKKKANPFLAIGGR